MDMWRGYIGPVEEHTDARIVFDKFHFAAHLSKAVDSVRRQEHRELRRAGAEILTGSRYLWLMNPRRMSRKQRLAFAPLRDSSLKVSRAWAIKETAMSLWGYSRRGWAERMWKRWYGWAIRSRLEPVKEVARMIRRHWQGVLNAATSNVTNARSEAINAKIQWIKRQARGYRNKSNFRYAILFHLGGLELYLTPSLPTRSNEDAPLSGKTNSGLRAERLPRPRERWLFQVTAGRVLWPGGIHW